MNCESRFCIDQLMPFPPSSWLPLLKTLLGSLKEVIMSSTLTVSGVKIPEIPTIVIDGVTVEQPVTQYARFDLMTVLNNVFNLLTTVLSSMQAVAAQQADRLNFLTAWQRAYTQKLQQVPTFVGGATDAPASQSTGPLEGSDSSTARQDLNQLNQAFTNDMQGNNSLIQDDAKSLQASVQQSDDAVNQLANLATSIVQQFSTILGSIFR